MEVAHAARGEDKGVEQRYNDALGRCYGLYPKLTVMKRCANLEVSRAMQDCPAGWQLGPGARLWLDAATDVPKLL